MSGSYRVKIYGEERDRILLRALELREQGVLSIGDVSKIENRLSKGLSLLPWANKLGLDEVAEYAKANGCTRTAREAAEKRQHGLGQASPGHEARSYCLNHEEQPVERSQSWRARTEGGLTK